MDEYVRFWAKDVYQIVGIKDNDWNTCGLEASSTGTEDYHTFIVCRVINKEKFLWAVLKHDLKYKPFNIYSSFTSRTQSKTINE